MDRRLEWIKILNLNERGIQPALSYIIPPTILLPCLSAQVCLVYFHSCGSFVHVSPLGSDQLELHCTFSFTFSFPFFFFKLKNICPHLVTDTSITKQELSYWTVKISQYHAFKAQRMCSHFIQKCMLGNLMTISWSMQVGHIQSAICGGVCVWTHVCPLEILGQFIDQCKLDR